MTIVSTFVAGFVLSEALTRSHLAGAGLVLGGIVLISWQGVFDSAPGERAWIGDALFLVSSILWAGFTLLIKVWRIDAVRATAVVAVLSLCVVVPIYLGYRGPARLAAVPGSAFVFQALLQGLLQSVITIMAFSRAVAILGVSRAVLFPAIVPAISVLIGIPALGEAALAVHIDYGMPDVLGAARERFAGRRILVVGAGHSAAGTLLALAQLAQDHPGTSIVWATRGSQLARVFGGGEADGLRARGQLGMRLRALRDSGRLEVHQNFRIQEMRAVDGQIRVIGERIDGMLPVIDAD